MKMSEGVEWTAHACVLLAALPPGIGLPSQDPAPVQMLNLQGLDQREGRALLNVQELVGEEKAWQTLINRYSGNPLALKLVAETVRRAASRALPQVLMTTQATNGAVFRTCEQLGFRLGSTSHVVACSGN